MGSSGAVGGGSFQSGLSVSPQKWNRDRGRFAVSTELCAANSHRTASLRQLAR
jgi:hypothetical protein